MQILSPTRELAQQIDREIAKYAYRGTKSLCIVGGTEIGSQRDLLRDNISILVGTPGRLNDLVKRKFLHLASVTMLVGACSFSEMLQIIDEADRMLDDGFEPQIRTIIELIRPDRFLILAPQFFY